MAELPSRVADLTRLNLGDPIFVQGWTAGWLYAIHDDFHDGYPSRTLILVTSEAGDVAEKAFTDSDPEAYPKTMGTVVEPWHGEPQNDAYKPEENRG